MKSLWGFGQKTQFEDVTFEDLTINHENNLQIITNQTTETTETIHQLFDKMLNANS